MSDEEAPTKEEATTTNEEKASSPAKPKKEGHHDITVGGITIEDTQFPLLIIFVSAIILLIALGGIYDWNFGWNAYSGYLVSIASISIALSFIALLMTKFAAGPYEKFGKHLCMFLFVWNFVGACFLTFNDPFRTTGNGYFASWGLVAGSALSLGMTASAFKSSVKGLGAIMGLLAASIIVFIATLRSVSRGSAHRNEAIYAMSLAIFTVLFLLIVMFLDKKNGQETLPKWVMFISLACISIMWIVEAFITTFRGPFLTTGNGYFGSWAAAIASGFAALAARKME